MPSTSQTRISGAGTDSTADGKLLRLSVTLLVVGWVLLVVTSVVLHPGGGATFEATFANYAASGDWAAVHLGEFAGTALFLGGLLVLFFALKVSEGPARWPAFFGAVSAGVTLVLAAVLYAVDGVALKQAVDAWASAPAAEKASSYASVLAIRWVEWGTTSYQDFAWGLTLMMFATTIVATARITRPIGYLMGLSGLAWLVLGWLIGTRGFTSANTLPQYAFFGLTTAWIIWLLISALLMTKPAIRPAPASG
jgi:hypothetical protein